MSSPTTFSEIQAAFHSMPMTKYLIPQELEEQWLKLSIAEYELEVGVELGYDEGDLSFSSKLASPVVNTLAVMMYTNYLRRELSRVMALNGIYGKDISITGTDATKRVTKQEYELELTRAKELLHKLKNHSYE